MLLVGPENDRGWSQAHREGGEFIEDETGAEMILIDTVNPADRPETSVEQIVDDMIAQGAQFVFMTSDDMKDGAFAAAAAHSDVPMIWSSGDNAWADGADYRPDLDNLANSMGQMEWGKMVAGCAAAMTSETGSIGYLGPLINDETRRLVNSAFLGAQYCWETVRGMNAADLEFAVNWIGFWFEIPGVTLNPTEVANAFFDGGADVVLSGIDTTQALVVAGQRRDEGQEVWAIPYDFEGACSEAPEACLGTPFFDWRTDYLRIANEVLNDEFAATFAWNGPDDDAVGWVDGDALSDDAKSEVSDFIDGLADGSIDLFVGPLNYQDGSPWLAAGEEASPQQIWYTQQLLEGVEGASS